MTFKTSSVRMPDIFCLLSRCTLKLSSPCFVSWSLGYQGPVFSGIWLGFANGELGSQWKEDGECGQVFISIGASLKGQLELAMLLGRRSVPSLKDLCKSLPLDSRLPLLLPSG